MITKVMIIKRGELKIIYFLVLILFYNISYSMEPIQPIPSHIEYDKEKAELGKILFHDPVLSKDQSISCASCHDVYEKWGTDHRKTSIGIEGKVGKANAPTVFNTFFNFRQFWNGRAKNLREQAKGPIHNPIEMGMSKEEIEKRLNQIPFYKKMFKKIYGTDKVRYDLVIDAIVEFEKALITPNSKFDRYLRGETDLSPKEKEGYLLFKKFGCITCHNGINVGGNSFQKVGVVRPYPWKPENPDRYKLTKRDFDKNRYKVPSLRNIACTYPYFHDGSIPTLREAIRVMAYHNLGFKLTEEEVDKIVAFLNTLTGELPDILKKDLKEKK
ncbi:cytochrome-c peroxidase [Persephonella sp.]